MCIRKNKLRKIIGIFGMLLVLMGCNDASEVYVKQQTKEAENEIGETNNSQFVTDSNEVSDDIIENNQQSERSELSGELQESDRHVSESYVNLPENPTIYVQVSGAVKNPGVYQLEEGSRIFQAIELAGGVTTEADINSINQARILSDGQMVYVYTIGEELNSSLSDEQQDMSLSDNQQSDGKVNLNTATVEELQALPGIGQSKAESIISYREEHGIFESVEGLMDIPGIKEGVFSKIKDHIKVN